jgi:hypothetical protein
MNSDAGFKHTFLLLHHLLLQCGARAVAALAGARVTTMST